MMRELSATLYRRDEYVQTLFGIRGRTHALVRHCNETISFIILGLVLHALYPGKSNRGPCGKSLVSRPALYTHGFYSSFLGLVSLGSVDAWQ